jgi:hypothetical protein
MNRLAIFISNYNMPERADALAEGFKGIEIPYDLYLVDNGSDIKLPATNTTFKLEKNAQALGGWLYGLHCADASKKDYFAYVFTGTSVEFSSCKDPITPVVRFLEENENAVIGSPALTPDSTTAWTHMIQRGTGFRRTWMVDNLMSIIKTDWFNGIGRWDPRLSYAWGIDLETSWIARRQGRSIWMDDDVTIKKVTNIGYAMNRMNMSSWDRQVKSTDNMNQIESAKYGDGWYNRMTEEYVTEEMR